MTDLSVAKQIADYGVVYCIGNRSGGVVKIGHALDVERRLKDLQTGHPMTLNILTFIPGTQRMERCLQRQFSDLHVRGGWYDDKDEEITRVFNVLLERFRGGEVSL